MVALTDKDIRQMFDVADGRVVWRSVPTDGLTALFRRAAEKHNEKAGQGVAFWLGGSGTDMITVLGVAVTRKRIEAVLGKVRQRPAPEARPSAEAPQVPKARPWDDPNDPRPDDADKDAVSAWELRRYDRMVAWERSGKGKGQ